MPSRPLFLAAFVATAASAAHAGTLSVSVTDAAGAPLSNAVVMLEPASGKAQLKPMAQVDVSQAKRRFQPALTVVTVGTPVSFPNFDTVRHHVYSFSPAKSFELKLYSGVPSVPIVFDKPGVVVLGCNIHDQMAAWVIVVDTPHHARTDASGRALIANAPAGQYKLKAWHASVPIGKEAAPTALSLSEADSSAQVQIATGAM